MSQEHDPAHGSHDVGPLADEAVRLLGALSSWAARNTVGVGQHAQDLAGAVLGSVRDAVAEADEHLATGAEECTVCPVCRTVSAVRDVSPEVTAHLVQAATSLVAAASGLLAGVSEARRPEDDARTTPAGPAPERASRHVEHIDLDDPPPGGPQGDG